LDLLVLLIKNSPNDSTIGFENKGGLEDVNGFGEAKKDILDLPSFLMNFRIMYKIVSKIGTCIYDFNKFCS
jgi:hypothetical protein